MKHAVRLAAVAIAIAVLVTLAPSSPAKPKVSGNDGKSAVTPELDLRDPSPERRQGGRSRTDNTALSRLLAEAAGRFDGGGGQWGFEYQGYQMMMFSDQAHNRMRIIAPVASAENLTAEELRTMLEANFDRALDAKYAIFRGLVWATYVHPLGELTPDEFESALRQVATLKATYGTTYTSTDLMFGGAQDAEQQPRELEPKE